MEPKLSVGDERDGAHKQPATLTAIYHISILKSKLVN
jgi:hypothetical protein